MNKIANKIDKYLKRNRKIKTLSDSTLRRIINTENDSELKLTNGETVSVKWLAQQELQDRSFAHYEQSNLPTQYGEVTI